jgi:muramoyltetrapeptide carboxypeptidase
MKKPQALDKGETVGVIAPSGVVDPRELAAGIKRVEAMGFRVTVGRNVQRTHRYSAGTDRERAEDLHEMFSDPEVRAVLCARGGYGATRLLPMLDEVLLKDNPKILVGSSDVTALLVYLADRVGLVAFHGPMIAPNFGRNPTALSREGFLRALCPSDAGGRIRMEGLESLRKGSARGRLTGGCLSLLCALLGTPYEPDTRDAVLFLEDVNEAPYRIDRMLTQLRTAGKLDGVRGLIFGKMVNCFPASDSDYGLEAVILEAIGDFEGPVLFGLPAGHGGEQLTLPFGVEAKIDGDRGIFETTESGVKYD